MSPPHSHMGRKGIFSPGPLTLKVRVGRGHLCPSGTPSSDVTPPSKAHCPACSLRAEKGPHRHPRSELPRGSLCRWSFKAPRALPSQSPLPSFETVPGWGPEADGSGMEPHCIRRSN